MKRVLVIGCGGSGKSTLSKQIHELTDLPLYYLDKCYWSPNWKEATPEEWEKTVSRLIQNEEWIMDGNYGGTMDLRIQRADTVIFLYLSTWKCLYRVIKRTFANWGRTREDMTQDCPERFDLRFFHYILMYNRTRSKPIIDKLSKLPSGKKGYILRNSSQIDLFLEKLKGT